MDDIRKLTGVVIEPGHQSTNRANVNRISCRKK